MQVLHTNVEGSMVLKIVGLQGSLVVQVVVGHHPVAASIGSPVPVIQPVVIGVHVPVHVSVGLRHVDTVVILVQLVHTQQ